MYQQDTYSGFVVIFVTTYNCEKLIVNTPSGYVTLIEPTNG